MRYMLDTNICIYLAKRHPPEVRAKFATLSLGDAVMSAITLGELLHGIERRPATYATNMRVLDALRERVRVVEFGEEAASAYARIAAKLARSERNAVDCLIASHALSLDVALVTNNERDFAGFALVSGLRVENWVHSV